MCFCEREQSGAGQVISLSQWESTPWNSPREARKAAFIIFLFYYCQNLLYFTFCSWRPFFSFKFQALSFGLCPIWTHRCLSFYCAFCSYIYLLTYCIWNQVPDVEILHRSNNTGSKYNQIPVFILSNEPLAVDLVLLSKVSQHAQHSS